MLIYLITYALSCFLIYYGNIQKNKIGKYIVWIGILIPCILAGLRLHTIGTDVDVYVKPMVESAINSKGFNSFFNSKWFYIWAYKSPSEYEIGFVLFVYILSKLFSSVQVVLFFIQALISIPIYFALAKYKELNEKEWLCMLLYYLLFFSTGMNAMRQFISISILFYGLSCLINDNKHLKFLLIMIVSFLFHKSAVLGIVFYILYFLFSDKHLGKKQITIKQKKVKLPVLLCIIFSIILTILVLDTSIISYLLKIIGFERYIAYIEGEITISLKTIIKTSPVIILFYIARKNYFKYENAFLYFIIYLFSFFLSLFSTASAFGGRVSYVFEIFNIIFFTLLCSNAKNNKKFKTIFLISYALVFWYYYTVYCGSNETVPYLFYFN